MIPEPISELPARTALAEAVVALSNTRDIGKTFHALDDMAYLCRPELCAWLTEIGVLT